MRRFLIAAACLIAGLGSLARAGDFLLDDRSSAWASQELLKLGDPDDLCLRGLPRKDLEALARENARRALGMSYLERLGQDQLRALGRRWRVLAREEGQEGRGEAVSSSGFLKSSSASVAGAFEQVSREGLSWSLGGGGASFRVDLDSAAALGSYQIEQTRLEARYQPFRLDYSLPLGLLSGARGDETLTLGFLQSSALLRCSLELVYHANARLLATIFSKRIGGPVSLALEHKVWARSLDFPASALEIRVSAVF